MIFWSYNHFFVVVWGFCNTKGILVLLTSKCLLFLCVANAMAIQSYSGCHVLVTVSKENVEGVGCLSELESEEKNRDPRG